MSAADDLLDGKPSPVPVTQGGKALPLASPTDAVLDTEPKSPVEVAENAGKEEPHDLGAFSAVGIKTMGQLAWNLAWKPNAHLPEAPKNLPNYPILQEYNPALIGGIWNGAVKPFFDSATSYGGATSIVAGVLSGATELRAGKLALRGMSGLFGGIMAKEDYDQYAAEKKIRDDPNSTFQDIATSYSRQVSRELMAVAGLVGAVMPEAGGVVKPKELEGKTPGQAADVLRSKMAEAPMDQIEKLKTAADKLDSLHNKQSDAAQAWDEVKQTIAPQERLGPGEEAGDLTKAKVTAGSLREHGAELAQRTDRATAALEDASKQLMKLSPEERLDFIDRVEKGEDQPTEELQAAHHGMREILDTKRQEIQDLGTGKLEHFIEDYFPHIWKDPEEAANAFKQAVGRAPLQGSKAFLKQRTIPTTKEGIALGLEPVSRNPVDLVLLKAREMDKYILGQKWMQEMKDREFVQYVKAGEDAPPGYYPINDSIAKVYGPKTGAVGFAPDINKLTVTPEDVTVYGQRTMGQYYAPSEVATVANNYLSPGLNRFATYRAYMAVSNSLNQFQLGFSAYHLGFTSLDTSISKLALALEYAKEGKALPAAKAVAQVPTAPLTNMLQGNKVLKEWTKPGSQGADIAKIIDAVRMAGGRAKMDGFYQTNITKRMMELFRERTPGSTMGALWRAPLAAIEQTSKPLMEYLVPRQKLGVFADLARKDMERLGPKATPEQMRAAFGKSWDSVDNRMGQMVYDNLFWKKSVKDLAMASVRSVGWDLGTIRELGGGMIDTAKFLKDTMDPKAKAEFTHRMAYMIALPLLTGIYGATYQYLKTGKGPEEPRDYYFPKTGETDPQGRDVRLAMPSYIKDVYHYAHAPLATIEGKVSPFPSLVAQMLNNKDFFGRDIRNADDPLVQQMADEAKYFAKSYEPIGVRQYFISTSAKQAPGERAANFVGITRAPAWVGETDAEQLAGKLAGDKFKSPGTPDAELVQKKQQIQIALRIGKTSEADKMLDELEDAGQLTPTQRKNLVRGTDRTYLENAVTHLDAKEAMRVFRAANLQERQSIADSVQRKIDKAHLPEEDRNELQSLYDKLLPPERNIEYSNR